MDEPRPLRQLDELCGLVGRHGQRLLAHNVLPGGECLHHLRVVEMVWRRDMDDVDSVVVEHCLVRLVRRSDSLCGGALARGADDPRHLDAKPAKRINVDDADEASADDACGQLTDLGHLATTGFVSEPMPSISIVTSSPGCRSRCGSRNTPTPAGVPVRIRSPGSSVVVCET